MQKLLISWIQALSTLALVGLAVWAGFFSEVGDLAIKRLQSDLLKTEQQMETIRKDKEELESQKQQLQHERNELMQQREEHITHVVNARLADLWSFGVRILRAHKQEAKLGQNLLSLDKQVEPFRNWYKGKQAVNDDIHWYFYFSNLEKIRNDERSEWGDLYITIVGEGRWKCSLENEYIFQSYEDVKKDDFQGSKLDAVARANAVSKWMKEANLEAERRRAERNELCFNEWENILKQRIESEDSEVTFTIKDFSAKLLQWEGINNAGEEVFKRIQEKLTENISNNTDLINLPIQLRVSKGATLQEIAEEANQVLINVKIARDWFDEATKDRYTWTE